MHSQTPASRAPLRRGTRSLVVNLVVLAMAPLVFGGCAAVPVYEQQLVSQTGMTFSDSLVGTPRVNLLSQIESGTTASGGAQAAGCTACR